MCVVYYNKYRLAFQFTPSYVCIHTHQRGGENERKGEREGSRREGGERGEKEGEVGGGVGGREREERRGRDRHRVNID